MNNALWIKAEHLQVGDLVLNALSATPNLIFAERIVKLDTVSNPHWVLVKDDEGQVSRHRKGVTISVIRKV